LDFVIYKLVYGSNSAIDFKSIVALDTCPS
jgi:hypothetical protein